MSNKWKFLLATAALFAIMAVSLPAQASVIAPAYTVYNTDFATAQVGGMRGGPGTGTVTLASGVTAGTVSKAVLYWHGPSNNTVPGLANVSLDGNAVTGTSLGASSPNCWSFDRAWAYTADVTSIVNGKGDGAYSLSGFYNLATGDDINGVSLVVYYDDGDGTNNRDIVTFEGNDSNISNAYDPPGWTASLTGINYSGGPASAVFGVADGQSFPDDAILLNGTTLVPAGNIFQGTGPGYDPNKGTNGSLWDINTFDVTSFLSLGPNALTLTSGVNSDCLSLVHLHFDLPAGSIQNVPEPATLAIWSLLGLVGLGAGWRRRRAAA